MNTVSKNKLRDESIKSRYIEALNDPDFKRLVNSLKVDKKELERNTSSLQETVNELKNCKNCKGLSTCKNKVIGCVTYPKEYYGRLIFSYVECKYKKEFNKKLINKESESNLINNARMQDIDLNDKKRVKLIKWVSNFLNNLDITKKNKGLYLHGSFGSGKTYILSAMFNELKKLGYTTEIVYFPTLLRDLKSDFDELDSTLSYLETVDFLLLDDIGAEKVSEWSRDEILGTILQSRMNNAKTTFFTSNFTIDELENHFANNSEIVKSRRIIERIKVLSEDMELISNNRRI